MQPKEALTALAEDGWFLEEKNQQSCASGSAAKDSGKAQLSGDGETAGRLAACVITGQTDELESVLQLLRNVLRANAAAGVLPALRRLQRITGLVSARLSVRNYRIGSLLAYTAADLLLCPSLAACLERLRADLLEASAILNLPPEQGVVQQLLQYLSRHYMEPLQLKSLSAEFGYESVYLGKLFRQKTGTSFHSCLNRIRIEYALELLESGMRVTDVAEICGYSGIHSFSRKFTELVGCSPAAYRAQRLKALSGPRASD